MTRSLLVLALTGAAAVLGTGCGDDEAAPPASPAPAVSSAKPRVERTTPTGIAARVAANAVLLVDVREQDEWDAGRAPEAVHVPLATLRDRLGELERQARGRRIAFICRSGNRSAQAARIAVDGGLRGVLDVTGGMGAWVSAGLPLRPAGGRVL